MIKIETNKGITEVKMSGTTKEVVSDLLVIVASVYNELVKENPEMGDFIKSFIRKHISGDMLFNAKQDGEADD